MTVIVSEVGYSLLLPGYAPRAWNGQRPKKAALLVIKASFGLLGVCWTIHRWRQRHWPTDFSFAVVIVSGIYVCWPVHSLILLANHARHLHQRGS
jgi:hypothetical protein